MKGELLGQLLALRKGGAAERMAGREAEITVEAFHDAELHLTGDGQGGWRWGRPWVSGKAEELGPIGSAVQDRS